MKRIVKPICLFLSVASDRNIESITILDLMGTVVFNYHEKIGLTNEIQIRENISPGMYLGEIENSNNKRLIKIVVF